MCSGYENPYENYLKFDHGGGSGSSYLDDRYGGYNRSQSDLGSDPYRKRFDAGPDAGMATVFMLTEVIIPFLQWLIISPQLWTKNWFCMKILKMHHPIKKEGHKMTSPWLFALGKCQLTLCPPLVEFHLLKHLFLRKLLVVLLLMSLLELQDWVVQQVS